MSISRKEREQLKKQESTDEHKVAHEAHLASLEQEKAKTKKKWMIIGGSIAAVFLLGLIILTIIHFSPGPYDDFAKCLTEKGAVMYGAMGWCKYTQGQKAMFDKSFRHVNYLEHTEFPADQGEISITPTWIINGKFYENARSFDELSQLTGCPLP